MTLIKKISSSLILVSLFLLVLACQKLEDLNINPNESASASMENLLPNITKELANLMVNESFLFANNAAQLTAKSVRLEVDHYNWTGFGIWEKAFDILADIKDLEDKAIASGNDVYHGVAIILKSYTFSMLTDLYGPIPYSQALQATSNNIRPQYDTQEDIYFGNNNLISELGRANVLLSNTSDFLSGDILFEGNLTKWKKFATSLSLRMLLRVSKQKNVSAILDSILANPGNLITSNAENAALTYLDISPNQNPISQLKTGDFDDVRISKNLVAEFNNSQDPRLGVYARPTDATILLPIASAQYTGWENGCGTDGCRLGYAYYNYPGHPTVGNNSKAIFISYSEVEFLIAEAIQRGFVAGNAAMHYQNGIESSMSYYQVDYAQYGWTDFNDYYNNAQDVIYNNDLNQIWKQKWMALFFHGVEPYLEVRRWLDYHNNNWNLISFLNPPCNNANNNLLPLRFVYPDDERFYNSANFDIAISTMGGNTQNNKMWLLK